MPEGEEFVKLIAGSQLA